MDRVAHALTNTPGVHALTAWREYNRGTFVEQRIREFYQLGFGRTTVDDLSGNAILAASGGLAYQVLHLVRTTVLVGEWRRAQPARVRVWLFQIQTKLATHARKKYMQILNHVTRVPQPLPGPLGVAVGADEAVRQANALRAAVRHGLSCPPRALLRQ